ncbi:MAG: hypothetical protein JJ953_03705 [Gracilimonas sp.]|uniref:hypothetical protein n=1 Tax=Gracilimonas sp. TaxID=1974203 RepID=UPI001B17E594|nr:hypothetical protein [Gracilimonas sp.]MBO6585190.1 hypothetical protein [Gracilimonas sp.]MBO6615538.1 hypothetical protein [Gracilimonas sp.]
MIDRPNGRFAIWFPRPYPPVNPDLPMPAGRRSATKIRDLPVMHPNMLRHFLNIIKLMQADPSLHIRYVQDDRSVFIHP